MTNGHADPAVPPAPLDPLGVRLQAALGDRYVVERQLGAGGFAVVYAVRDLSLKRLLAVKVLSPDLITTHSALDRFRREAETIAQLSHPHIVPLHFIGERDDLVYLAMAAIDGGTLSQRLERDGPLSVAEAARILGEVAGALAHAHKRGVIHRDIKPDNVLLEAESGRALVTDFGIARTAEGGALTATGMVVGTAGYLSPEQINGEPSDRRGDIYALGVMGYQLLAGRLPFEGANPLAVLMRRLAGPPEPLKQLRPDVPDAMADLIESCLAVDAAARPADAGDVVRALAVASSAPGLGAAVGRDVRVAAALALVAVVALILKFAGAKPTTPGASPAQAPAVDSAMALIPAGTFPIGSSTGPASSRPLHNVTLGAFGIDLREVTVGEYDRYVQATRAAAPWDDRKPAGETPVTGVTLDEASRYCAWRHSNGGRLPSEDEWEAAARGAEGRLYPWGNAWDAGAVNTGSRRSGPAPVGTYPRGRSPLGLDDLIGNVWEWTSSPYKPYAASGAGAADAPSGPGGAAANDGLYVIRGGAYNSLDSVSTAVFRGRAGPSAPRNQLAATGFRCAMPARPGHDGNTTAR